LQFAGEAVTIVCLDCGVARLRRDPDRELINGGQPNEAQLREIRECFSKE
jgi:hypothetical protein